MQNRLQVNSALERLGTETAFEVLARAEALAAEGKDVINLGIGQPDFKTPPHVVEAAMKALQDGAHGHELRMRPSGVGADLDPGHEHRRVVLPVGGGVG